MVIDHSKKKKKIATWKLSRFRIAFVAKITRIRDFATNLFDFVRAIKATPIGARGQS
jgi:hypothetical protein